MTWGPLNRNITATHYRPPGDPLNDTEGRSGGPNALWDATRKQILVFFQDVEPGQIFWIASADAVSWSAPVRVFEESMAQCTVASPPDCGHWTPGPGKGAAQLTMGEHRGRILLASYSDGVAILYSDDLQSWKRSIVPNLGGNASWWARNNTYYTFCEPQLAEMSNGTVRLDMRREETEQRLCLSLFARKTLTHFLLRFCSQIASMDQAGPKHEVTLCLTMAARHSASSMPPVQCPTQSHRWWDAKARSFAMSKRVLCTSATATTSTTVPT